MEKDQTYTAFQGHTQVAAGNRQDVGTVVRGIEAQTDHTAVLAFDDQTGRQTYFEIETSSRIGGVGTESIEPEADSVRSVGRPKLGVVAREITLLPRHWDWLASQPGGASVAIRKLVESARTANADEDRVRQAQEATDRFMGAVAGNYAGYEEASRALYASNEARFLQITEPWPADIRDYARRLAAPVWKASPAA